MPLEVYMSPTGTVLVTLPVAERPTPSTRFPVTSSGIFAPPPEHAIPLPLFVETVFPTSLSLEDGTRPKPFPRCGLRSSQGKG